MKPYPYKRGLKNPQKKLSEIISALLRSTEEEAYLSESLKLAANWHEWGQTGIENNWYEDFDKQLVVLAMLKVRVYFNNQKDVPKDWLWMEKEDIQEHFTNLK